MRSGDVVGDRFVLEGEIGSGGMGVVYRAHDRATGGPVAVKVLRDRGALTDPRFEREAMVLESLVHPAIVGFVARGATAEGQPFLAMSWLEGETLSQRLLRGPLSLGDTLTLGMCIASALQAAHDRGIVHRDLKPSNVFLRQGQIAGACVLDFGIARVADPARGLTATGEMLGTPGYMSPEQARGERSVDARTDVFALGCVLFRAITARPAFDTSQGIESMMRLLTDPSPRLADHLPQVPPAFAHLVDRMLHKELHARPPHGGVVLAELRAIASDSAPSTLAATASQAAPTFAMTHASTNVGGAGSAFTLGFTPPAITPGFTPTVGHGAGGTFATQPARSSSKRTAALVVAAIVAGAALLGTGLLVADGLGYETPSLAGGKTACFALVCGSVRIADAARVQSDDVFPEIVRVMAKVDARATLNGITFTTRAPDGSIDLRDPYGSVRYEFANRTTSDYYSVDVYGTGDYLVNRVNLPTIQAVAAFTPCRFADAWKATAANGRRFTNAIVQLDVREAEPFWSIMNPAAANPGVTGLSLFKVSARTCRVTMSM